MRIIAKEFNKPEDQLEFCWLPTEIKDNGDNVTFASYQLLDRGEIARPSGNDLRKISWEGRFPGEARKDAPYLSGEWKSPKDCNDLLRLWKSERKKVALTVDNTTICDFICYVNNYSSTYTGGFGDIEYSIEWIAYKPLDVEVKKRSSTVKIAMNRPKKEPKIYVIKSGDTLWGIASRFLGAGKRYPEIYKANKKAIEQAAHDHHQKTSKNGNWIWPGTRLKLPKK